MERGTQALVFILLLCLLFTACNENDSCPTAIVIDPDPDPEPSYGLYAGAEACADCHRDEYAKFVTSGHYESAQAIVDGQAPHFAWADSMAYPIPGPPANLDWADVGLVIGGANEFAVFADSTGSLITGGNTIWDGRSGRWLSLINGGSVTEGCGCHFTGYRIDGLPGRSEEISYWEEAGVSCEACHGPGGAHATSESADDIVVDRSDDFCNACHDLSGGHRAPVGEQFPDGFDHFGVPCVVCHNVHASVRYDRPNAIPVECWDCHRPNLTQSGQLSSVRVHE